MKQEQVLSLIYGGVMTASGPKQAIGNAVYEVGDWVWTDGSVVFGNERNESRRPVIMPALLIDADSYGDMYFYTFDKSKCGTHNAIELVETVSGGGVASDNGYYVFGKRCWALCVPGTSSLTITVYKNKTSSTSVITFPVSDLECKVHSSPDAINGAFDAYFDDADTLHWGIFMGKENYHWDDTLGGVYSAEWHIYRGVGGEMTDDVDLSSVFNGYIDSVIADLKEWVDRQKVEDASWINFGDQPDVNSMPIYDTGDTDPDVVLSPGSWFRSATKSAATEGSDFDFAWELNPLNNMLPSRYGYHLPDAVNVWEGTAAYTGREISYSDTDIPTFTAPGDADGEKSAIYYAYSFTTTGITSAVVTASFSAGGVTEHYRSHTYSCDKSSYWVAKIVSPYPTATKHMLVSRVNLPQDPSTPSTPYRYCYTYFMLNGLGETTETSTDIDAPSTFIFNSPDSDLQDAGSLTSESYLAEHTVTRKSTGEAVSVDPDGSGKLKTIAGEKSIWGMLHGGSMFLKDSFIGSTNGEALRLTPVRMSVTAAKKIFSTLTS